VGCRKILATGAVKAGSAVRLKTVTYAAERHMPGDIIDPASKGPARAAYGGASRLVFCHEVPREIGTRIANHLTRMLREAEVLVVEAPRGPIGVLPPGAMATDCTPRRASSTVARCTPRWCGTCKYDRERCQRKRCSLGNSFHMDQPLESRPANEGPGRSSP
jgi:hypothetical protein